MTAALAHEDYARRSWSLVKKTTQPPPAQDGYGLPMVRCRGRIIVSANGCTDLTSIEFLSPPSGSFQSDLDVRASFFERFDDAIP